MSRTSAAVPAPYIVLRGLSSSRPLRSVRSTNAPAISSATCSSIVVFARRTDPRYIFTSWRLAFSSDIPAALSSSSTPSIRSALCTRVKYPGRRCRFSAPNTLAAFISSSDAPNALSSMSARFFTLGSTPSCVIVRPCLNSVSRRSISRFSCSSRVALACRVSPLATNCLHVPCPRLASSALNASSYAHWWVPRSRMIAAFSDSTEVTPYFALLSTNRSATSSPTELSFFRLLCTFHAIVSPKDLPHDFTCVSTTCSTACAIS